jgi:hypothetical protein
MAETDLLISRGVAPRATLGDPEIFDIFSLCWSRQVSWGHFRNRILTNIDVSLFHGIAV